MASPRRVVIVGAGVAGARCAETLRAEGFEGQVVVVGEEPIGPYERPALSKELLAGRRTPGELQLRPESFFAERGISMLLGRRVARIDVPNRRAILVDGHELAWDALVLATGASSRSLPATSQPNGALSLRTLEDALRLRDELTPGSRLAIVGAGFVGSEVASTALSLGVAVTVIDTVAPMERVLGAEVAGIVARRLVDHGGDLRTGSAVAGFRTGVDGRVRAVLLERGDEIRCDAALIAVGARPSTSLVASVESPEGGVATDSCGRTAVEGVYACGDVATVRRGAGVSGGRCEHWTSAAGQARAVACTLLGNPTPYDEQPYFWSDQLGLRLQLVGRTSGAAVVEIEGEQDSFVARYAGPDGTTCAALAVNRPHELGALRHELALAMTAPSTATAAPSARTRPRATRSAARVVVGRRSV